MDSSSRIEEWCVACDVAEDVRGDPLVRSNPLFWQREKEFDELSTIADGYISGHIWDEDEDGMPIKMPEWKISDLKTLIAAMTHALERESHRPAKMARVKKFSRAKAKLRARLQKVANFMLAAGVTDPIRDRESCGNMWHILVQDWLAVDDYDRMRYFCSKSYYELSPDERRYNPLFPTPPEFPRELYDDMSAFHTKIFGPDEPEQRLLLLKRWVEYELLMGREGERDGHSRLQRDPIAGY